MLGFSPRFPCMCFQAWKSETCLLIGGTVSVTMVYHQTPYLYTSGTLDTLGSRPLKQSYSDSETPTDINSLQAEILKAGGKVEMFLIIYIEKPESHRVLEHGNKPMGPRGHIKLQRSIYTNPTQIPHFVIDPPYFIYFLRLIILMVYFNLNRTWNKHKNKPSSP